MAVAAAATSPDHPLPALVPLLAVQGPPRGGAAASPATPAALGTTATSGMSPQAAADLEGSLERLSLADGGVCRPPADCVCILCLQQI